MDPVTLGVVGGVALGSGILSYLNSEKARKASAAERKKLEEALSKIQDPTLDASPLTPEEYKVVAKFVPEEAKLIQQQRPELVTASTPAAQQARQNRLNILNKLMEQASTGRDVEYEIQAGRAQDEAARQANAQRQNIEMDMQRRGMAGSGLGIAARLATIGQGAQQAALAGEQAALAAEQRRRQALSQASGLSGQIYGEELDREMENARIINNFNDAMANRAQQNQYFNAGARQDSSNKNQVLAQSVADQGIDIRNKYGLANRDRAIDIAQQRYQNQLARYGRQAGTADMARQDIIGAAQDKNALYGSLAQTAGTMGMAYGNAQEREKDRKAGFRTT